MAASLHATGGIKGQLPTDGAAQTGSVDAGAAATNTLAICRLTWRDVGNHTMPDGGVSYGGNVMEEFAATTSGTACRARLYRLVNPPSGSNTLSVDPSTGSAAADFTADLYIYKDVDQSTPTENYVTNVGTDTTGELTITSTVGDLLFYTLGMRGSSPTGIAATQGYSEQLEQIQGQVMSAGGDGAGAASTDCIGTISASVTSGWIAMGCSIKSAAAGGAVPGGYYQQYYKSIVTGIA